MYFNNRRGFMTAVFFAVAGLVFALWVIQANTTLLPGAPGVYILLLFFSAWELGHGLLPFILLTNPLLYAVAGYAVGAFSRSPRQVIYIAGSLAIVLFFSSVYLHVVRPYVKEHQSVKQRTEGLTKKLLADPNDVTALFCMGVHRFGPTDEPELAKKCFLQVVALEEFGGEFSVYVQRSFMYLALIYQSSKEQDLAESYYKKFLATEPDLENDFVLLNYNRHYLEKQGQSQ
jgi:hypothetical protein